ncbi:tape measure protein [Cereibacter changlensis]|uniref:tape measure protein n=1 Tax=Cereibacter changlensis TaxID=402884 RepID=UPI004034E8DE
MADLNVQLILRLVDRATAPARAALRGIERIGGEGLLRQAAMVGRGTERMATGFGQVTGAALKGGAVIAGFQAGIVALGAAFIAPAAQFERFQVQLTNLEGSAEGADRAMAWIEDFAVRTPLELEDTVAAYARLKAFGLDPTKGALQALTDTMAATGGGSEQLDGLVLALGQSWTKGKLQGEEAMQMLERGVPVWDLLSKKLGKTTQEVIAMSSSGELGRKEIQLLIDALGEANAGASAGMAGTWSGIMSNISDQWTRFQRMVMGSGLFDWLKTRLQEILATLDAMVADGSMQLWADRLAGLILRVLTAIWEFGLRAVEIWRQVAPIVQRVVETLGGWDVAGWIVLGVAMHGTVLGLAAGLGTMALGALQAGWGILSMLAPMNLVRTAALAWIGMGLLAAVSALAVAGLWIWRNWSGLTAFFRSFGAAFRSAMGPAAPILDRVVARIEGLWAWVQRLTGPVDESGESWIRWGRATGEAVGRVVRAITEWSAAHPRLMMGLGAVLAALGLIRLLITPVTAAWRILTAVASALGTVLGFVARAVLFVGRALLLAGRALLANPILLVIAAIAGAAYVIYQNWDGFVAYFQGKIDRVKAAFEDGLIRGALTWISEMNPFRLMLEGAVNFTEYLTGWDLGWITEMIENAFSIDLYDAGVAMIQSLWNGIRSKIGQMAEWVKAQLSAMMPEWLSGMVAPAAPAAGGETTPPGRALGGPVRAGQLLPLAGGGPRALRAAHRRPGDLHPPAAWGRRPRRPADLGRRHHHQRRAGHVAGGCRPRRQKGTGGDGPRDRLRPQ